MYVMDKQLKKTLTARRTEVQRKIRVLQAEMEDIDRLLKRYSEEDDKPAKKVKGWTDRTSNTKEVLDKVETILELTGDPMKPAEIINVLVGNGVTVSGNNPANTLSAMLSGAKSRFKSLGRTKGWVLVK